MSCTKWRKQIRKNKNPFRYGLGVHNQGTFDLTITTMYFHLLSFSYMITLKEFSPYVI